MVLEAWQEMQRGKTEVIEHVQRERLVELVANRQMSFAQKEGAHQCGNNILVRGVIED